MTARFILSAVAPLVVLATVQLVGQEAATQPVTLTGCLQRANAKQASVAGRSLGTTSSDRFVITDVRPTRAPTSSSSHEADEAPVTRDDTVGSSGTTRSAPTEHASKGPWYSVVGELSSLRGRVNRRVEISGTIDTAGSVLGTSASVTDGPSGTIHVTTIETLGACAR